MLGFLRLPRATLARSSTTSVWTSMVFSFYYLAARGFAERCMGDSSEYQTCESD